MAIPKYNWRMNDDAATTLIVDSMGNSDCFSIVNTDTMSGVGKIGKALTTDTENYILNHTHEQLTPPMTLFCWFQTPALGTAYAAPIQVFGETNTWATKTGIGFDVSNSTNKARLYFYNSDSGGSPKFVSSNDVIAINTWYHLAATIDASFNMNLYVGGVLQTDTNQQTGSISTTVRLLLAGITSFATTPITLDDIRVYDEVLSQSEIIQLAAMSHTRINIGDDFKYAVNTKINIGDSWKDIVGMKQNIGGVWKDVF